MSQPGASRRRVKDPTFQMVISKCYAVDIACEHDEILVVEFGDIPYRMTRPAVLLERKDAAIAILD